MRSISYYKLKFKVTLIGSKLTDYKSLYRSAGFMHNHLRSIKFSGKIWKILLSANGLVVDERIDNKVQLYRIDSQMKKHKIHLETLSRMTDLASIAGDRLYIKIFIDSNDPNKVSFRQIDLKEGSEKKVTQIPQNDVEILYPQPIDLDSPYHQVIQDLLQKKVVGEIEYFELQEWIVVSYYLVNQEDKRLFDRYLAVIKDEKFLFHELQDLGMSGPTPDAFCIFENQIFFIRNTNEICIYSM